jgi:hypothetical protein
LPRDRARLGANDERPAAGSHLREVGFQHRVGIELERSAIEQGRRAGLGPEREQERALCFRPDPA